MEFVRQIVNSNALEPILTLPPSFRDVEVEVIVLPVDNRRVGFSAPLDDGSLAYLFRDYVDDGIREPMLILAAL